MTHVIEQGFPFPDLPLDSLGADDLEARTRKAYSLGRFWLTPSDSPSQLQSFAASSGMSISDVRFLHTHPDWLITVSKGIWSVITCWDRGQRGAEVRLPRKVAEYSPKGAVLTGIAVNSVAGSEASLAVSIHFHDGYVAPIT